MERITESHLNNQLHLLNENTGNPVEQWNENRKMNVNHYTIDYSYGGCKLVQIVNESGGQREVTNYRLTKRELYYVLHGMNTLLRYERGK